MESLIKQTRSKFGGNKEDRSSNTTDTKIPPQKTQSLREKKRSSSLTKKQVSRQMSWEYDFSSTEYPTAIAAAAYAIQSLEYDYVKAPRKTKSRTDETEDKPEPLKSALKSSDEKEDKPEPLKSALKSSDEKSKSSFNDERSNSMNKRLRDKKPTKKISFADMDEINNDKAEKLPFEKAPSLKSPPPPFPYQQLNKADSRRPEAALPKPEQRPTTTTRPGPGDSAADAWEMEEMISIKERYEKLRSTIDNWEKRKKEKVKRKIAIAQGEMDNKKVKKYNSEIERIEEIASGATAQAEENRRKEELKVKEKANKIRETGKIPKTCLCF